MSFVKLDTGILDSTLWLNRDERDVFVTALLMAEPREFADPIEQIAVDTLDRTGFVAPAGWYGFIRAAGPGIVRRALVAAEDGLAALVRLGSPDPESRTPDHEGRRLVRVDGGYLVLNFMRYRDKDSTGAERAKRYRERQKAIESSRPSRCDVTPVTRDSSLAEAEAEREAKKEPRSKALVRQAGRFDEFWSVYPNKTGKKPCQQKWQSRNLDAMADRIIADVKTRIAEDRRWQEGFIPNPETYLNQDRWTDEIQRRPPNGANGTQSKTLTAIQRIEGMKHGLAGNRADDGNTEVALLGFGPHPGK